jgi:hypothetical protein
MMRIFLVVFALWAECSAPGLAQTNQGSRLPASAAAKHAAFADVVRQHFAAWDLNHDGKLEAAEIDELIRRPGIHGEEAAALATIKKRDRHAMADKIADYAATEAELLKPVDSGQLHALDTAQGATVPFRFEPTFESMLRELGQVNRRLYANESPSFASLHQGGIGDCFFFSVVGNLARRQPQRIVRMITPDERGGYQVHFGDGVRVDVAKPTDVEIVVNNSTYSIQDGVWLTVLEKAVGHRLHNKAPAYERTTEETDTISFGGSPSAIISMFTGHQTHWYPTRDKEKRSDRLEELREVIPEALAARRLMTATMGVAPPEGGKKVPGWGYHHVYAVFGYDSETDHIKLWNPWGNDFTPKGKPGIENGYETKHGVFELPLKTFYNQFSGVVVETNKKVEPPKPK